MDAVSENNFAVLCCMRLCEDTDFICMKSCMPMSIQFLIYFASDEFVQAQALRDV